MQTVCETPAFIRAASVAGMTSPEIEALVGKLAANPSLGVEIVGTGGCRKLRLAGRGKGKSGGYRVVTFYSGVEMPVFLLTVFSKGQKANLTPAERSALAALTATLKKGYRR
jgi:hypothetical protein